MSSDGTHARRASRRGGRASQQSSRVSASSAAAVLIMAGILGFVGGAITGASSGGTDGAAEAATTTQPGETPSDDTATDADGESPEASPGSEDGDYTVTLIAEPTTVPELERIDLQGNLEPPVEGVTLVVERRLEDGDWQQFGTDPVEAETRDDGSFSTWVQTGRTGPNEFRLVGEVDGQRVESQTATVTVEASDDDDDDDDDD